MKVHLIKDGFDRFKEHLQNPNVRDNQLYKYDIINHFNGHWAFDNDLAEVIEQSLQSEVSRRIWHRENFNAKSMMVTFAKTEPDYCYQMFKDLFDESRKVDARIDRFKFYCDELFNMYRKANPRSIETSHDQDAIMISLYLSGRFPTQYALYPGLDIFSKALKKFESPKIPLINDLDRFFKVCKAIQTLAQKDETLLSLHNSRFESNSEFANFRQFSSEFIAFMGA